MPIQTWSTFLKNQAQESGLVIFCLTILFFRTIYVFFIIELGSRCAVHLEVTLHPTDAWVAQQLREATAFGQVPQFLMRDRDGIYGDTFMRVVTGTRVEILRTPCHAP